MPFKIGHSFDIAPIGPRFVNWPIANSKYSNGIPQNIITRKYGIKNIPKNKYHSLLYYNKYYIVKLIDCQKCSTLIKINTGIVYLQLVFYILGTNNNERTDI